STEAAPRRSSGNCAMKSRRPFAPMIRISRGPASTEVLPAAVGSAVSQPSPTASSKAKADLGNERDTTIRLSAGRLRRNGLRRHGPGAAQHAGHATDQGVGPGKAVRVVSPELADGPAQDLGADILSAGVVHVVAATWRAGRVRSPWQPNSMQRLRSSDMIAAMMKATCSLTAREAFFAGS